VAVKHCKKQAKRRIRRRKQEKTQILDSWKENLDEREEKKGRERSSLGGRM
jgi:hypothetical protein